MCSYLHKVFTILLRIFQQKVLYKSQWISHYYHILQTNILNDQPASTNKFSNTTTAAIMAQIPPADIATMPTQKVVFNAPFEDKRTYYMKVQVRCVCVSWSIYLTLTLWQVINTGNQPIGFAFKTTNPQRFNTEPPSGVLDAKEGVIVAISCDAFDTATQAGSNDRVTVEWTNAPAGSGKQFRREWFQGDGMVRRKNLPIEYNM